MKLGIVAESQDEFDQKRPELIRAIAGSKLKVAISPKGEKLASEAREPFYLAQKQMLSHWDRQFRSMLEDIKKEVSEIIEE